MAQQIQTLVFTKEKWTLNQAKSWLNDHDFRSDKVDETENSYRFRQFDPSECQADSYMTLTENFPAGINAVSCNRTSGSSSRDESRALTHNSTLSDSEPGWGSVDKTRLPRGAFADQGEPDAKSTWSYPHHWVQNGCGVNDAGIYTTGTMYLHRGGLNAAWSAANGGRAGQEASAAIKSHLQTHRRAIGMEQSNHPHDHREIRAFHTSELRVESGANGNVSISGYAAVFNQLSEELGFLESFREMILPGAFAKVIREKQDVRFLINHDGLPLARTASGTMSLREDQKGLVMEAMLDPSDPDVQRLVPKVRRGDLSQMSFAFSVEEDGQAWELNDKTLLRKLTNFSSLYDVSAVTFPAYPQTDVSLRNLAEAKLEELRHAQHAGDKNDEHFEQQLKKRRQFVDDRTSPPDPLSWDEIIKRARIVPKEGD